MKKLFALCVILTMTLTPYGLVAADITVTRPTNNPYEDTLPQIKGNYLVWQGRHGGHWEIFLYDISDSEAEPIRITHNDYDDISPQTDGNYVVWRGYNRTGGEIFVYHIGDPIPITSGENAITSDTNIDCSPQIADGRVVWTSHQVTDSVESGEIMLYEIGTQTATVLSASVDPAGTLDDSFPRINDSEVMWVQADGNGDTTLFVYDLTLGNAGPAPDGFVWEDSPQTDGHLTVMARHDGSDREIFLYDSHSRRYHQITNNDFEDSFPRISGNYIAWVGGEGQASEIYVAYFATEGIVLLSPEDGSTLPESPPATFSWESYGYEKFKVQFCTDPDFPRRRTLTLPFRRQGWLSDTSFTPTRWQWKIISWMERRTGLLFWRVKGRDTEGNKYFSEVWSFTIE